MKTRYKLLIFCSGIIILILFLQAPSIFGQPGCEFLIGGLIARMVDVSCNSWKNWDWIYYNTFERDRLDCFEKGYIWRASENRCVIYAPFSHNP